MKPEPQAFLNVERSVCGKRWIDRLDLAAGRMAGAIAQQTDLSEILARIIAARGVAVEDAQTFIAPTIRALMPDPSTLAGMDALAQRLARAIIDNEPIGLFGDYDVDGASAVARLAPMFWSSTTTWRPIRFPMPTRWSIPTGVTTFPGSVTCAPPA